MSDLRISKKCPVCDGSGVHVSGSGEIVPCMTCSGTGRVPKDD